MRTFFSLQDAFSMLKNVLEFNNERYNYTYKETISTFDFQVLKVNKFGRTFRTGTQAAQAIFVRSYYFFNL